MNENSLPITDLLENVAVNSQTNRRMAEDDFRMVVSYMVEKEFAYKLSNDTVYVLAKSLNEISNELMYWAEKEGMVDKGEFDLIEDLYEMNPKKNKRFPASFSIAPKAIKNLILEYTQNQGKITLDEYDGDRVYKFVRNYK